MIKPKPKKRKISKVKRKANPKKYSRKVKENSSERNEEIGYALSDMVGKKIRIMQSHPELFEMFALLETSDRNSYIGEKIFFAKIKSGSEIAEVSFVPGYVEEFGIDYVMLGPGY